MKKSLFLFAPLAIWILFFIPACSKKEKWESSASVYRLDNKQLKKLSVKASKGDVEAAFRVNRYYIFSVRGEFPCHFWEGISIILGHESAKRNWDIHIEKGRISREYFTLSPDQIKSMSGKSSFIDIYCLYVHYDLQNNREQKAKYRQKLEKMKIDPRLFDTEIYRKLPEKKPPVEPGDPSAPEPKVVKSTFL